MNMYKFDNSRTRCRFSECGINYDAFLNLIEDTVKRRECLDKNANPMSKDKVNHLISCNSLTLLGLNPEQKYRKKELRKAWNENSRYIMDVWEDVIDFKVTTGFQENEFFNTFVESLNISESDRQDFYSKKEAILSVAEVSGGHHNLTMQKLTKGQTITIPMHTYAIEVGQDIDLFLTGRKDWAEFPEAVSKAFLRKVQENIFTTFIKASESLPTKTQFKKTIQITTEHKNELDTLLEDVSMANDGAEVIICGLMSDLQKLTRITDVTWASESKKDEVSRLGRLGTYEGRYPLMEITNRFVDGDVTKRLITPGTLYILPNIDNKFIKFVDSGETYINEKSEKGLTNGDLRIYETQRAFGVGVVLDKYHGEVTIG